MKKIVISVIAVVILNLIAMNNVFALTTVDAKLNANKNELKKGQEVEVTFKLDNFKDVKKGINAYKATLQYDTNIFEQVFQNDFECQNNWEELKYNVSTKEFVAIRKVGTKQAQNVVKIRFKVKANVPASKTEIKLTNIAISEGKKDIELKEAKITLNIIKEQIVIPTEPTNPGNPNNGTTTTKPPLSGNIIDDDPEIAIKPENPGNPNKQEIEEPNKPDTETENPDNDGQPEKIKKTTKKYSLIFISIFIEVIVVAAIIFCIKKKLHGNSKIDGNKRKYMSFLIIGILFTELIGASVAFAVSFAQKGELNGDTKIDYADVGLLELHLVNLKKLPNEKLENADMNSDGKLTITDLSILIQKLENSLEYEVDVMDLSVDKYYPNKNEDITVTFNGYVSYGANIEKIVLDGKECEIIKTPNKDFEYTIGLNVGKTAGIKTYKITEAYLDNGKKVKLDYEISVDVLKNKPTIYNYAVLEDIDNSKLIITFDVEDEDDSLEASTIKVFDKDTVIANKNFQKGKNRIEVEVKDNIVYQALIELNYNLDSNQLENDEDNSKHEIMEKELQLIIDYNFNMSNIKTYKDGKETTTFTKDDNIEISFESTNSTKFVPLHIKVNGVEYELTQVGNTYKAKLSPSTKLGTNTISIDEVILSNGKKFELTENNTQSINIIKRKPNIKNFSTGENEISLKVLFELVDEDEAVSEVDLILLNAQGQEINSETVSRKEIESNDGIVRRFLSTENVITSKYELHVKLHYNLTGNSSDDIVDDTFKKEIESLAKAKIQTVTPDKYYVEKSGLLKLTYNIITNKEDIKRIVVNNVSCIATKLANGEYEITLEVGTQSGIYEVETTKIYYNDGTEASVENKINVDILKEKPNIENFKQTDNVPGKKVILSFDVTDRENSFINGKAVLTSNGISQEKAIVKGHNILTFDINLDEKYVLEIKSTYDLDSNTLPNRPQEDNKIIDGMIDTREIEVISDYKPNISNIKTYNGTTQTIYFERGQQAILSFDFTNQTSYYPIKVVVNGIEYALEKQGDNYKANITVFSDPGPKEVVIQKVILNNTKELELTENNVTNVGILKLRPTVSDFGYEESDNDTINISFKVNDTENTITGGKIIITDENGKVVKEEAFTRNSTGISFAKSICEEYEIKVLANYDLDSNQLTTGDNEYLDQVLLLDSINVSIDRLFEIKDITDITLYKKASDGSVIEVSSLTREEVENFDTNNYLVKVQTEEMPTFYSALKGAEITSKEEVKLLLDYDNTIQYENDAKYNGVKVTYGKLENGIAQRETFESFIAKLKENPTGTFQLDRDYNASNLKTGDVALILGTFNGTINGNGHTITNLPTTLFEKLDAATIKDLTIKDTNINGSKAILAITMDNSTIENVHIAKSVVSTSQSGAGAFAATITNTTIRKSSATNVTISASDTIGGITGLMGPGSIVEDCYVTGQVSGTADNTRAGGITGWANGTKIEKVYTNVQLSGKTHNGGIVGGPSSAHPVVNNAISIGGGIGNRISGFGLINNMTNVYEYKNSSSTTNIISGSNKIKEIENIYDEEFYRNTLGFDETIWNLDGLKNNMLPTLRGENDDSLEQGTSENLDIYIPEYHRVKNISGFNLSKRVAYHNINKLMPYYDAKYLVIDGKKIDIDSLLNTKTINHVLPYSNGKLLTYLTTENYDTITSIKIVFNDYTVKEYNVEYDAEKTKVENDKLSVAIYNIPELNLTYAYDNYIVKENSSLVEEISNYIKGLDYATKLDPLTSAGDSRLYKDYFNGTVKAESRNIALQLLQNNMNGALSINNEILERKLKQDFIDNEALNKIVYAYNYYYKWYNFEIRGTKVSDLMLFEGKTFNKTMTLDNVLNEVFQGNMATNKTDAYYKERLAKYTGSSTLQYFLNGIIGKIGGYTDVNDWFTEYMNDQQAISEIKLEKYPELKYRAWSHLGSLQGHILPLVTMPKYSGYVVSAPTMFIVGAQRVYALSNDNNGRNKLKESLRNQSNNIKIHLNTLAGTFDRGRWNNYFIRMYDSNKLYTQPTYIPGLGEIPGKAEYAVRYTGQEAFHKYFMEAVGVWVPYNSSTVGGIGGANNTVQFIGQPALKNFSTLTHEWSHSLLDKMFLFSKGIRYSVEETAHGHIEQSRSWSEDENVAPLYFNTTYYLNKENLVTQNITPDRIDTREKLENYYKGQQNAIDILDYVEAQAFIKLTPEQQSKLATRISQSGASTSWGTISKEQAESMNLTTLESLWDNKIVLRPLNAWGVHLRGKDAITSQGPGDYGFESAMVTRWYITHNPNGQTNSTSTKRNFFEMLGYGGVDAYVIYGSRQSANDLDAIQKITKAKTGTAMNWKEYKMSRYDEIEKEFGITNTNGTITSNANTQYVDIEYMIEKYYEALVIDANNSDRNISQRTNLRKIFYHYLKRVTNDFVEDPYGTDLEVTHIKTAEELVEKINARPYGYYVLDNDIDFSGITANVTQTFMGKLDGKGHKIVGNTKPIFNKIRFGYVKDVVLENTNIPENITNQGALSATTQYSIIENVSAKNLKIYFGTRNDISLIGGSVSSVTYKNISVEKLKFTITNLADFSKLQENPSSIFVIENDIDFTGYTGTNSVITGTFTGEIDGKGHTLSNLSNLSLFENFNGKIKNLNIKNFSNEGTKDFATAFANKTSGATLQNMRFEGITLSGNNNVAVISGMDGERDGSTKSLFENISVKNADVTGAGVYVSTFIGRKFNGTIRNVFVEGNLKITTTENGGIVGASQKGGTIENVISKVNIHKTENTYTSNIANSEFNGGIIGNIYDNPTIKNSIALGNMKGFTDSNGTEKKPYKLVGALTSAIVSSIQNCYESAESEGFSRITEETKNNLKEATDEQIHTKSFYRDTLHFDESIWNLDVISEKGYPELR